MARTSTISRVTQWVLMGISVVIFALFFLVGYDTPWEEKAEMNAPECLDLVLVWVYILSFAAIIGVLSYAGLGIFKMFKGVGKGSDYSSLVYIGVILLTVLAFAIGYSFASGAEIVMLGNGTESTPEDASTASLWLNVTYTLCLALVIAIVVRVTGAFKIGNKV